jgi:starch phosphorylase
MTALNVPREAATGLVHAFLPRKLPAGLEALQDLALDLRWTWSHASDRLWQAIDRPAWEITRNPWLILESVSGGRLEQLAQNEGFRAELQWLADERRAYLEAPRWYGESFPDRPLRNVAYFSMEFGLGDALPLYAGGLGVLAGDFLKTASDLGIPLVGIGLLYQQGYFRQILDAQGRQSEAYPYNDPVSLPIFPVLGQEGSWTSVNLELPGRTVLLRLWHAHVGRVSLYLLDSNDPLNSAADRGITSRLYDAQSDVRLLQEMVLGIAGWRACQALNLDIDICHLNEGHAAFVVLERARSFAKQSGLSFEEALCATRAGNIFTTHTPVAAGFDVFEPALMVRYFRDYAEQLEVSLDALLALGRSNPNDPDEPFNMAFLAGRGSIEINGVSELHGEVSRNLAQPLFPRWPAREVPVGYVTNGVHMPSWDSEWADDLWTRAAGKDRWLGTLEKLSEALGRVTDIDIWAMRARGREALVSYARERLERQLGQRGADPVLVEQASHVLDPNALTLGFARRFAAYKRPGLLLTDQARLEKILRDPKHLVQLVVAGKAHPQDDEGKQLVREMTTFADKPEIRGRVVFLEDYDIALAQNLVQGVDVWINTPRRPWEACGTSGMKVLVNGGLNLSELDGWWAEAYQPEVGWALGDRREHNHDPAWDAYEAHQLYELLESQIIREFYDRDSAGLPRAWIARIRASMARLAPRFSSNRMLREYVVESYIPAAAALSRRTADGARRATDLHASLVDTARKWSGVHFGDLRIEHGAGCDTFNVQVYLGELARESVAVELYADPTREHDGARIPMRHIGAVPAAINGHLFSATVPASRPTGHYTPRIIPHYPEAQIPLEDAHILWER